MYSEKVMNHFRNPRNMGEIPDADGVGTVGNPVCGDVMTIYIKVENGRIVDIKFVLQNVEVAKLATAVTSRRVSEVPHGHLAKIVARRHRLIVRQ